MWKQRIDRFYRRGLWDKKRVVEAVDYGKINKTEYKEITGEKYS